MIWDQFKDLYTTNKKNQKLFQGVIDEIIKEVDYSNINRYEKRTNQNGRLGVYMKLYDKWSWSWINTINTNYTCLYLIVDYINGKYTQKITKDWLSRDPENCIDYFKKRVKENKDTIFKPGSPLFKQMFFTSQKVWNDGLISTISSVITISKFYSLKCDLSYERGLEEDMIRGTDMLITIDDKQYRCQHKSCDIRLNGNFYLSKRFIYNEKTYRNNLDLISIENDNKIYLFENSKDTELCGTNDDGIFKIHKDLIKKIMDKENMDATDLLKKLNILCGKSDIIFSIEKNNSNRNYFEESTIGKQKSLRFFLNDFNDKGLSKTIEDQYNKLQ
jgi:hypothetical protein